MQKVPFRNYPIIAIIVLFIVFAALSEALATADGCCPVPNGLRISINGTVLKGGESIVVDEDTPINVQFLYVPWGSGGTQNVAGLTTDIDSTTTDPNDWQPDHANDEFFHDPGPPHNCWQALGKDVDHTASGWTNCGDTCRSHAWSGVGWKATSITFNYKMDADDLASTSGYVNGIPAATVTQTYNVPSVPRAYRIEAGLSMTWQWPHSLEHVWEHKAAVPDNEDNGTDEEGNELPHGNGFCDDCGQSKSGLGPGSEVGRTSATVRNSPATRDDPRKQYWGHSIIENCAGAEPLRRSTELCDPNTGALVVRNADGSVTTGKALGISVFVIVRDKSPIAHIQSGFGADNVMKAECGKKISATDNRKLKVRIVDNAPCATPEAFADTSIPTAIRTKVQNAVSSGGANCKDNNFQLVFWYEWPIYQYMSYYIDDYLLKNPTTGNMDTHKFCNVLYSPMFVWKQGKKWDKLSNFIDDPKNSSTTKIRVCKDADAIAAAPYKGGQYIIYEGEFPLDYLLKGDDASEEDYAPIYYAKSALGDGFGNPGYAKAADASPLYDQVKSQKDGSTSLIGKFKYKPINFKNGKGPLKYFFEACDASGFGGGKGEAKFNCKSHYFKESTAAAADLYTQPQLRFNPDEVKYMVKSTDPTASANLPNDGSAVDTTAGTGGYCPSDDYAGDSVQTKWKTNTTLLNDALAKDVDDAATRVNNFQAWGRIEIVDKLKPVVGFYVKNTVTNATRFIYKVDDIYASCGSKLPQFGTTSLDSQPESTWATIDLPNQRDRYNYYLLDGTGSTPTTGNPNVPFDNTEDEWLFDQPPLDSNNKLYEGASGTAQGLGIGVGEGIALLVLHQDLRNTPTSGVATFVRYYAHDNIDGQRVARVGNSSPLADWFKGVAADTNNHVTPTSGSSFADDLINKGYLTWKITDSTFPSETDPAFEATYKTGSYFTYPNVTFSNPNSNWDGTPIGTQRDIYFSYAVIDRNNNWRSIKVKLYVAPTETNITTLEKREKKGQQ